MPGWKLSSGVLVSLALFSAGAYQARLFQLQAPASRGGSSLDLLYLPSPQQARLMSLGFTTVAADYYWVKALQYFTDPTQARNHYKNLADLLEVVVGLDPDFQYAYKFAGIAIPHDVGRFRFKHTERSTSFLERGVRRFPDNWELHLYLGFNYLNYHGQPKKAAEQFVAASRIPGAPAYLSAFAAKVFGVSGELDRAMVFAYETLQNSQDPEVIAMMKKRLQDLKVERELRRIEDAAKAFQQKNGRYPFDIGELLLTGVPPPPEGYRLDPMGVAHAPGQLRLKIHLDPKQKEFGAVP